MDVRSQWVKIVSVFRELDRDSASWLRINGITAVSMFVFLAANVAAIAQAQAPQGPPTGGTQPRRSVWDPRSIDPSTEAARQKALKLAQANALKRLNQIVDEADLIADAAARSRMLARIASALWTYDETRARNLFKLAYDQAINVPKPAEDIYARRPTCGTVRAEIARLLIPLDHKLAAQLVSAADLDSCDYGPRSRASSEDARSELLTDVALGMVDNDPAGAYRVGLKSLDLGIVSRMGDLLKKLLSKDKSLGEKLLEACIARISSTDVNGLEIVYLTEFMFGDEVSIDAKQRAAAKTDEDVELKNSFAKKLLEAALAATSRFAGKIEAQQRSKEKPDEDVSDPDLQKVWTRAADLPEIAASYYAMMLNVTEGIRRYDADKLPAAQALMERLVRWMNPIDQKHFLVFYDNGDTPESLAAEAESARDANQKRELFKLAVWLALEKDEAQALEYVAKVDDQDLRDELTDDIWMRRVFATPAEHFAEAHGLIEKIRRPEARLGAMLELAERAEHNDDKQKLQLANLLDEAEQLALSGPASLQQASIMMRLARLSAQLDPNRGFEATTKAIAVVNSAPEQPIADKTRWQFKPLYNSTDAISLFVSDPRLFEILGKADYDRTIRITTRFSNPALVIAAQLQTLRTALPPTSVHKEN